MAMNEFVKLIGPVRVFFADAIPTGGGFQVGDICIHTDAAAGQPFGWYCTVASATASTWKYISNIES